MATIVVTSDIHLGITPEATVRALRDRIAAEAPDLTVLAGDLGEPFDQFNACLTIFADLPGEKAVLAGNHDLWAREGRHSQDLFERDLPQATRDVGMLWLEEAPWQQDGVAVAGSLAWYDYSAADPAVRERPAEFFATAKTVINNDAKFLDWPWPDPELAHRLGNDFVLRLQTLQRDPAVRQILVVTHVPLCESQLVRKPDDPDWGISTAYFGNLTLGEQVLVFAKVRAIISGHTHLNRRGRVPRVVGGSVLTVVIGADYGTPAYVRLNLDAGGLSHVAEVAWKPEGGHS